MKVTTIPPQPLPNTYLMEMSEIEARLVKLLLGKTTNSIMASMMYGKLGHVPYDVANNLSPMDLTGTPFE